MIDERLQTVRLQTVRLQTVRRQTSEGVEPFCGAVILPP